MTHQDSGGAVERQGRAASTPATRWLAGLLIAAACVAVAACGGGDGDETAPATPTAVSRATLTAASPEAQPTGTGATVVTGEASEVTGIVGAVSANGQTIEITRTSGATVNQIRVTPTTRLRRAGGGRATVSEIRPSDRVIARGVLEPGGEALVADEITVQAVVPGSAPGG